MFISLKELKRDEVEFSTTYDPGVLDFRGAEVEQLSALFFAGSAELVGGEIRIRGRLEGAVRHGCDRCLDPVDISVGKDLDLFYRPRRTIAREEEVEISKGESEVSFFTGDGIELKDLVSEQVILSVPMKAVCRPECKGLCPTCGANRNVTNCGCKGPERESPFADLKKH
ncbi:MAG: DUF177 domain-containing protein [Acidobacteriota bacterium]